MQSRTILIASLLALAACSETEPPATAEPAATPDDDRPNILLIMADDLGYTDLGAFGGEIPTPNLDALAFDGVRLTNLHMARACQQTRAMMMSSRGVTSVIERFPARPDGQRTNRLTMNVAALPELMKDTGYSTFMTGKWDLGLTGDYRPSERGFDRTFVLLEASSSHMAEIFWGDRIWYEEDGTPLTLDDLPENFYSTQAYTDKMLEFLSERNPDQPWFAYVAYTAPHWPLQLPNDWLNRHAEAYEEGYDVLRSERTARAAELGVIPEGASMDQFESVAIPWAELTDEERQRFSRAQEIYAGMVEYLDMSVGRIIDYLADNNELDNTFVLFLSDHGASAGQHGVYTGRGNRVGGPRIHESRDNSFENFGRIGSFIDHGIGFGEAATAPLKHFKTRLTEGGLRAPAFIRYPKAVAEPRIDGTFITALDILPTFLEIAGTSHPGAGEYKGREIMPVLGTSFWRWLDGTAETVHDETDAVGWSMGDTGAIIRGSYKAINQHPLGGMGAPPPWELYNISIDPSERNDIAAENPDLLVDLIAEWEANWQ